MSEMNFGRQLQQVTCTITGGDRIDREHWRGRLISYLNNQPCMTIQGSNDREEIIIISPDANND